MPCSITREILEAIGKSQRRDTHRAQVERLVHNFVACCEVPVVLEGFLYLDEDVDGLRARELLTGWLSGRGTWSVPKERCTRPRTREVGEGRPRPGRPWSAVKARQRLLACRSWCGLVRCA